MNSRVAMLYFVVYLGRAAWDRIPLWQCMLSLFTLDGRRDMSLQKISANTRGS